LIAEIAADRGMTSDSKVLHRRLRKIMCRDCGLLRDGLGFESGALSEHYGKSYQLNTTHSGEEHIFYTAAGPVPRSQVIHNWILQIKPAIAGRVLEVGCGQGSVLERLKASFQTADFHGIDLSEEAVARARFKGLNVRVAGSSNITDQYDTIIAFGVLEHVPSPTAFLQDLRNSLHENGDLIIGQPMQDVPSYDLFFVDHLHHFTTNQVRTLAQIAGLEQIALIAGCALAPNFSLHRLKKIPTTKQSVQFEISPSLGAVKQYLDAFGRVNDFLHEHPRIAVFGTGEVFTLLYAYTDLAKTEITCGLDDNKDRQLNHAWPFPIISPEQARKYSVSEVLLSINPRYNEMVTSRLRALNLKPIAILNG
jgi:2-polyprenyl-3-methyl-5-hydroxy-6-metoxy-1,4-benzoquinol methylase